MSFSVLVSANVTDAVTVTFDFGDGSKAQATATNGGVATVSHIFAATGNFNISVTAQVDGTSAASVATSISVTPTLVFEGNISIVQTGRGKADVYCSNPNFTATAKIAKNGKITLMLVPKK